MLPSPRSLHCSKLVPLKLLCKSQAASLSPFYSRDLKVMGFALQLSSYRRVLRGRAEPQDLAVILTLTLTWMDYVILAVSSNLNDSMINTGSHMEGVLA